MDLQQSTRRQSERKWRVYAYLGVDVCWVNAFPSQSEAAKSAGLLTDRYKRRRVGKAIAEFRVLNHLVRTTVKWNDLKRRLIEMKQADFVGKPEDPDNDKALIAQFLAAHGAVKLPTATAQGVRLAVRRPKTANKTTANAARQIGRAML